MGYGSTLSLKDTYRNIYFEPADFVSFTITMLENYGIPELGEILLFGAVSVNGS